MASSVNAIVGSLPYSNPARVLKDSSSLTSVYRTLQASKELYFSPQGQPMDLVTFKGTVAMFYKGAQYNIPVDMYLPYDYPNRPPMIYVRPTQGMQLKSGHKHVDREGLVYLPYLSDWRGSCNLVTCCQHCSNVFGVEPPVYAKGQGQAQTQAQPQPQPQPPSYDRVSRGEAQAQARPPPSYNSVSAATTTASMGSGGGGGDGGGKTIDTLTRKIQAHLSSFYNDSRTTISASLKQQQKLNKGGEQLTQLHTQLRRLKDDLTLANSDLDKRTEALEAALKEREARRDDKVDPDLMVVGFDDNSAKMLGLVAQVASAEDCIYWIDRAVNNGTVGCEDSLKEIRKIARRQFLAKAHIKKIVEGVTGQQDYQLR
jgi:ESCRT-I complex subunit TSG101